MFEIEIKNELNEREYQAVFKTQEELESWKTKHVEKNTWGLPERVLVDTEERPVGETLKQRATSTEEVVLVPAVMQDVYETKLVEYTDEETGEVSMVEEPVLDEEGKPVVSGQEVSVPAVTATAYTIPADYVITETDLTLEYQEKEQKEQEKKEKKETATVTLSDISGLDLSKKEDLQLVVQAIIDYLGV